MLHTGEEGQPRASLETKPEWPRAVLRRLDIAHLGALVVAGALGYLACMIVQALWEDSTLGHWLGIAIGLLAGAAIFQILLLILPSDPSES